MAETGEGRHGLTPNVRGALWMLGSAVSFVIMTTLVKYLGKDYSAALQTFYRQLVSVIIILPVIIRHRGAAFATTQPLMLCLRSAVSVLGLTLSFYAFQKMPLADASALSFTRSLFMVPIAAFLLRERVGPLRIGAALFGFLGVLIMVRPGAGGHFAIGLPGLGMLASSFMVAFTIAGMKVLTRTHTPTVLLVWAVVTGLVFSIPGALLSWHWPAPKDLVLLGAMGVLATLNQVCYINGIRTGEAAAMAPIDYTRLVFAAVAGYFLFHDIPNVWTLSGAAVVVGSTLFITWREHVAAVRERGVPAADVAG